MSLSDENKVKLLAHVNTFGFRTNVLSALFEQHVFNVVQALAVSACDLKAAKRGIGRVFCDDFEKGIVRSGF